MQKTGVLEWWGLGVMGFRNIAILQYSITPLLPRFLYPTQTPGSFGPTGGTVIFLVIVLASHKFEKFRARGQWL